MRRPRRPAPITVPTVSRHPLINFFAALLALFAFGLTQQARRRTKYRPNRRERHTDF
jgi:hypothetical protein